MINFTIYSRSYCHLCDDMLVALKALHDEFTFEIAIIDVDADESMIALYDELVPVLVGDRNGEATQICHYFLDESKVRSFLRESAH